MGRSRARLFGRGTKTMSQPVDGFPEPAAQAEVGRAEVWLEVDESLYPLDAVYGAAFTFLDRCYVLLDRPSAARLRVTLTEKSPSDSAETLRGLLGELANELLASAWRQRLSREHRPIIEAVTLRAMEGALGGPTLDDLAQYDFGDEALDDPLGIAVAWEEKYGSRSAEPRPDGETAGDGDGKEGESRHD
jgi:His-Xaa-Ser system protein HxsD